MKSLAILALWVTSVAGQAQITSVPSWRPPARVLGVTAQQAVLTYAVPAGQEAQPCVIEVSPSKTYAPLVPDVDGTLFPGANLDTRPGAVANGRVRTITIGKRTVEIAADGNNYSRSLAAATTYYYRVTCPSDSGGQVVTGAFATGVVPSGLGAGDPIPVDPNHPGRYLYPTMSATDRTATTVDPHTGALVKNMVLPADIKGQISPTMGSSGTPQYCHPTPVRASDEDKLGYHCSVLLNGGISGLYWIAPDGETRFLGSENTPYAAGKFNPSGWPWGTLGPLIDISTPTPNNFYWLVPGVNANPPWSSSQHYLLEGVYTGHDVRGQDADLTNQPLTGSGGMPHTTFTVMTPSDQNFDRSVETLLGEFDPNWTTYGVPCCRQYIYADFVNGKLLLHWLKAGADHLGWIAIFDPDATAATQAAKFGSAAGCIDNSSVTGGTYGGKTGCIVGSMGTFTGSGGSPFRYAVLHTADGGVNYGSGLTNVVLNDIKTMLHSAYAVTVPGGLPASGSPCAMPQPSSSGYISNWPDTSWGPGCTTIAVSGDPALTPPISGYPPVWAAAPGDFISIDSGRLQAHEIFRLLDKGSDGNTWYVQRQYGSCGTSSYDSVAAGGALDLMSLGACDNTWWDYTAGPKGTDYSNTYLDTGLPLTHNAFEFHKVFGRWSVAGGFKGSPQSQMWKTYSAQRGVEPARFNVGDSPIVGIFKPGFNRVACAPNSSGTCAVEGHPATPVLDAPDAARFGQFVDNHPYFGDSGLVQASNVTPLGGQLYRIRGTSVLSNYKKIAYFANSGNRAMREVSGPAAQLAVDSSTEFQWCLAWRAGECYSGSLPGDIYFNAPNIANPYCSNNWTLLLSASNTPPNDICVSPAWRWTQGITMQQLASDLNGATHRTLSNALGKYDAQVLFWNSRTIPDGSWLFTSVADGTIKLFKVPPMVQDAVNRTAYVPVNVTLPPTTGADGVVVEFGYGEQGEGRFFCTARGEACVANAAAIDPAKPFYFEAETYTPQPCASGCTIAIPGISGKVVEYRLKMFSGSAATYTSPMMLTAVP